MKILHTLDSLNRGGAETLTLDVCRNARAAGLDLIFVATGGGDLEAEFRNSGVEFIRLQRRLPVDLPLVWQLRQIIKERKIKIVHAQQAVEALHLYLATRGLPTKCVLSLQNYILDEKNRRALKFLIPRMDAVCGASRYMIDWFRDAEGFEITDKFHVIYNGVDIKRLQTARDGGKTNLRAELNLSSDAILLGMIGNFYADARKDQLTICRALPKIFARHERAHFVFVGAKHAGAEDYYNECVRLCAENGIAERVHFIGKRADIPAILETFDLFVFSSVQEGLPIATVEALLMGVPTLVSDIAPLLEVTQNGACADLFRTGDANDLAEKLESLMRDENRRRELGARARALTPKLFSIEAHLASLRALYDKLAKEN
jgi:glycosyltransferase involved in cell wall biosynthesis